MMPLLQAAEHAASSVTPTSSELMAHAVEAVVLGGLYAAARFLNRKSGKAKEDATHASRESLKENIEKLTNSVDGLRGDVGGIRDEMRASNNTLHRRVDGANQMLTGAGDGNGPNGLREKSIDHERRIRTLERAS